MRRRNSKRAAETCARNFGEEAEAVRAMPCLCRHISDAMWSGRARWEEDGEALARALCEEAGWP